MSSRSKGLKFQPFFVAPGEDPFKRIQWRKFHSKIQNARGEVIFEQKSVEAPAEWTELAVDIAASRYFRQKGLPKRISPTGGESSVRQLIKRVVATVSAFGRRGHYFSSVKDQRQFENELAHLCLTQMAAFNSPVWFNCGLHFCYGIEGSAPLWRYDEKSKRAVTTCSAYEYPQSSACFIISLEDDLGSIFELAKVESRIFKFGSGSGTNFSILRAKDEPLESGGRSSGVLAFLEVLDRGAGATKSGGTTRRAAKMVCLDVDHPEILDFIRWKSREEKKAEVLVKAGYSGGLDGEAYHTVGGQNANLSVRLSDAFMKAVSKGAPWETKWRTNGKTANSYSARQLWQEIAGAAWECADPGVQFHDTINAWHTSPHFGPIRASNPCAEYFFVDDSACNLASLNLVKFLKSDGEFDAEGFKAAVRTIFVAQEILVGFSGYPTAQVAENSFRLRPLGIGFANLGGLLMRMGLPYDSDEGRAVAASIAALMTGTAYAASAEMAQVKGPFAEYRKNRAAMLKVMTKHQRAAKALGPSPLALAAQEQWALAIKWGKKFGYRNAQASVLAPTGTIGLFMSCETTGIEPDFALVKVKQLAGGGELKIMNQAVEASLQTLGYDEATRRRLLKVLHEDGTMERHPDLKPEHRAVFDCAQRLIPNGRVLSAAGHLKMMAAVQPFLSGGISKTVNLPQESTIDEVGDLYFQAWQMGLKAIAIYRDTSKGAQPLRVAPPAPPASSSGLPPPTCSQCGYLTIRSGNCYKCLNCGHSESCG